MKKVLLSILACAAVLSACKKETVMVQSIMFDQTSPSVVEGSDVKINATVLPENAEDKTLEWSSSDQTVATVDAGGTITGVKAGSSKITAIAKDGSGVKASCTVTVTAKAVPVTSIELSIAKDTIYVGKTTTVAATVNPSNATNKTISFGSSKESVATVGEDGTVNAVAEGTAEITATATDGSSVKSNAVKVVVIPEPRAFFLDIPYAVMKPTGTKTIRISGIYGTQANAIAAWSAREEVENGTWKSNNEGVVTVSANGTLTAVAAGETTVVLTSPSGSTASCKVTVLPNTVKPKDYVIRGIKFGDCCPTIPTDQTSWEWYTKKSTLKLGEGYVTGTQCLMNENKAVSQAPSSAYRLFQLVLPTKIDASNIANPALFFRFYVEDVTKLSLEQGGEIEISSSGKCDVEELNWAFPIVFKNNKLTLKNGWNTLVLPFSAATAIGGEIRLANINFFRMFEAPDAQYTGGTFKIDQLQIVDWTSMDNCDNYDMWWDGNAVPQRQFIADTQLKKEGTSSVGFDDFLWKGAEASRLKFWEGLEYAMPFDMDESNATLKFWLYIDKPAFLKAQQLNVELSSNTNTTDVYDWTILANQINFTEGWNEISLPFGGQGYKKNGNADVRKINWIRITFQFNTGIAPQIIKVRFDDFRIVKTTN